MQPGWHEMTIADLRKLCVDSFPSSTTRVYIVTGLEFVVGKLISSKLSVDIWVNGSFLTSKINPEDSDIVLRIQVDVYNGWTEEQRSVIDWMANDDLKTPYHCITAIVLYSTSTQNLTHYGLLVSMIGHIGHGNLVSAGGIITRV